MSESVLSLREVVVVEERNREKSLLIAIPGQCKHHHPHSSNPLNYSVGKGVMCILQMRKLSLREEFQSQDWEKQVCLEGLLNPNLHIIITANKVRQENRKNGLKI